MTGTDADVIMTFVQAKPAVRDAAGNGSSRREGDGGEKRYDQEIGDKGSGRQWINLEDKAARIKGYRSEESAGVQKAQSSKKGVQLESQKLGGNIVC